MSVTTKRGDAIAAPNQTRSNEENRRRQIERNQPAIDLLDAWGDADEAEIQDQIETWEFLKRALDEDRPSYRKFFP